MDFVLLCFMALIIVSTIGCFIFFFNLMSATLSFLKAKEYWNALLFSILALLLFASFLLMMVAAAQIGGYVYEVYST